MKRTKRRGEEENNLRRTHTYEREKRNISKLIYFIIMYYKYVIFSLSHGFMPFFSTHTHVTYNAHGTRTQIEHIYIGKAWAVLILCLPPQALIIAFQIS